MARVLLELLLPGANWPGSEKAVNRQVDGNFSHKPLRPEAKSATMCQQIGHCQEPNRPRYTLSQTLLMTSTHWFFGHAYTIGTLDLLQACDACADMGMTYSVIVYCTDCVVFRFLFGRNVDLCIKWGAFQQRPGTNCTSIGGAAHRS